MSAIYTARLAPLDEDIVVTTDKHGTTLEHFHNCIFALERKQAERVKVCLDHDEAKTVGHLDSITQDKGWLVGTFRLDERSSWSGVAEDRRRSRPRCCDTQPPGQSRRVSSTRLPAPSSVATSARSQRLADVRSARTRGTRSDTSATTSSSIVLTVHRRSTAAAKAASTRSATAFWLGCADG